MTQQEIINFFNKENIKIYIQELVYYYFNPIIFYDIFFKKNTVDKIYQVLFYSTIIILIGYYTLNDLSVKQLVQAFIFEVFVLVLIIIPFCLSTFISKKFLNGNLTIENSIFFVVLAKMMYAPFQIVFFFLFLKFENYNYLFFSTSFVIIIFFNIFYFSSYLFYNRWNIFFSMINNFIVINLFFFGMNYLTLDNYYKEEKSFYTDYILEERVNNIDKFKNIYRIPRYQIVYSKDNVNIDSHFLFSSPFDSTMSGSFNITEKYIKNHHKNIVRIDSIIQNCKYERNKIFFNNYKNILLLTDTIINRKEFYINEVTEIQKLNVVNNLAKYERKYVSIPNDLYKSNLELVENQISTIEKSEFAFKPLDIFKYLLPLTYLE
ncbi:hypothetical protein [Faecalibacter rhinopitheci]|uniref:Uncharacterized protein n=1 Tax=Faecalibacter rhinopitheci TaxID=2779678 RepID=A0A8J7FLR3_9FLAO|nr:hypothetical protein [Faecalibacter rhinopitheci]MBF0596400.1 hypothetical protein [Faecalibacter rhinopitheci]